MRVVVYSTKPHDEHFVTEANLSHRHRLSFLEPRLSPATVPLAGRAGP